MDSVVVLTVRDAEPLHEVVGVLDGLEREGRLYFQAATTVKTTAHGLIAPLDEAGETRVKEKAAEAIAAALLYASTGPVGSVTGGAAAAIVESLLEIAEPEEGGTVMAMVTGSFPPRKGAVVPVVEEATPLPLEGMAAESGATLLRRPRADVERDLANAPELVVATRERKALRLGDGTTGKAS